MTALSTHPPVVQLVLLHFLRRRVPADQDGEGRGGPGGDVGRGRGQVHLGLGGDGHREAGEAGALLVVGHDPDGVGGAGEETLQGDLLQGAPGGVDDSLPERQLLETPTKKVFPLIFIIKLLVNVVI